MKSLRPDLRFYLLIGLIVTLSYPITAALGYTHQNMPLRILMAGATLMTVAVCRRYPGLALGSAGAVAVYGALIYLLRPSAWASAYRYFSVLIRTSADFRFCAVIVGISLAVLLLNLPRGLRKHLLFAAGVITFPAAWYLYIDSAFAAGIVYGTLWLVLLSLDRADAVADGNQALRRSWLNFTGRTVAVALLFSLLLPGDIQPLPWTDFQIWINEQLPRLSELRGGEGPAILGDGRAFSVAVSGFGESADLGGPVSPVASVLLEMRGAGGLYLKGSVWDNYDGNRWLVSVVPVTWLPTRPSVALRPYLRPTTVTISHVRLSTSTVFGLDYTTGLGGVVGNLSDIGGGIASAAPVALNSPYTVSGFALAYTADFSSLEDTRDRAFRDSLYTRLPSSVPQRVHALAQFLTAGLTSDFDRMKALEQYLRSEFPYDESPGRPPAGSDFVDFFLFVEQKGYCTSFATALAVMGRSIGIPTRYVQGFLVPADSPPGETYRIGGRQAHAWTEAYIRGLGWIPFEPTPAYADSSRLPVLDVQPLPPGDGSIPPRDPTEPLPEPELPPELPPQPEPDVPGEPPAGVAALVRLLPLLVLLALPGILLWRGVCLRRQLRRIEVLPDRSRAIAYYNLSLDLLAGMGMGRENSETPSEYAERIHRRVYDWQLDFRRLSGEVSALLYGRPGHGDGETAEMSLAFYESTLRRYRVVAGFQRSIADILLSRRRLSGALLSAVLADAEGQP